MQRFFYEKRRFWIDSLPKRCAECRRTGRNSLELRNRYYPLIGEALGQCPLETKKQVVQIINDLEAARGEMPEQMIENRSRLYGELSKAG